VKRSGRDEPDQVVHGSKARNLYPKLEKCHVFLIISYVFSSTELEKRAEQVLPGSEGV
jgi:hypothetical protein